MCSTTSGCLQELKNKGKDQLVIPKSADVVAVAYGCQEWSFMRAFNYRV